MKLYEIQHINEQHNPNKVMGAELRFTHSICSTSGKLYKAEKQPKDWQHVRRLTHMLFLAWNDENPIEGVVYLGEFIDPELEDVEFYNFFKDFNGYLISEAQKSIYKKIKNGGNTSSPRQSGATTLLLTMAAYEAKKGYFVVYFGHCIDACKIYQRDFNKRCAEFDNSGLSGVNFRTFATDMNIFRGRSKVRVFFDNQKIFDINLNTTDNYLSYRSVIKPITDFKQYSVNTF